jgi:hypothetical protein
MKGSTAFLLGAVLQLMGCLGNLGDVWWVDEQESNVGHLEDRLRFHKEPLG